MKVLMFAIMKPSATTKPPTDEALLAMHNYNEELQRAGVLLDLGGLMPTSVRVKFNGNDRTVVDGPYAEAKEVIAGYSLLEVKTLAEAVEYAKRAPFTNSDGEEAEVELRPLFDPSQFDTPGEAEARAAKSKP